MREIRVQGEETEEGKPATFATQPLTRPSGATVSAGESGLDISVAQDLHGRLPAALQAKQPALLDAASIEHADTAALQLFSAFFRAASASGIAVHWQ